MLQITAAGEAARYTDSVKELLREAGEADLRLFVSLGGEGLSVSRTGDEVVLRAGTPSALFRGAGHLLGWLREGKTSASAEEQRSFDHLTYMVDCSRNAVCSPDYVKSLIRRLSLMGYDRLMLYTEDTYEIPEYPFFGYLRGRYSQEELRSLDAYAASFGVELVPCIQTLAHLNGIFHWRSFGNVRDTGDILCCDLDETYDLIEAMVRSCAETFRSRVINIGMDEAEMIGRGAHLKKYGYEHRFDVMERHLRRVLDICEKYGFTAMMWSDMFFKMVNGDSYHGDSVEITPEIRARIPQDVELVYWDYYTRDRAKYDSMLRRHHRMTDKVAFAGGAWKWNGFAPLLRHSMMASRLALESCAANGVQNVIVTGWGDNGGEAAQSCVLPVLSLYAEACWAGRTDDEWIAPRLFACTGAVLADFLELDSLNLTPDNPAPGRVSVGPAKYLLYQDALIGLFDGQIGGWDTQAYYEGLKEKLVKELAERPEAGDYARRILSLYVRLADALSVKAPLGEALYNAYEKKDMAGLRRLAQEQIPLAMEKIRAYRDEREALWQEESRIFGFEVFDIRIGGLLARLESAKKRVEAFVNGETERLPELEEKRLPFRPVQEGEEHTLCACNSWKMIVSASPV